MGFRKKKTDEINPLLFLYFFVNTKTIGSNIENGTDRNFFLSRPFSTLNGAWRTLLP
jgi:hypothetical protein